MFIYQTELRNQYYDRVIDLYKNEHLSIRKIAKIFPLSKNTVARWIANCVAENPQQARVMRRKYVEDLPKPQEQASTDALPKDMQALQAELKKLRAQLTQAEIKAERVSHTHGENVYINSQQIPAAHKLPLATSFSLWLEYLGVYLAMFFCNITKKSYFCLGYKSNIECIRNVNQSCCHKFQVLWTRNGIQYAALSERSS